MKRARGFVMGLLLVGLAQAACAFLGGSEIAPPAVASPTPALSAPATGQASAAADTAPASATPSQPPSAAAATATPAASVTRFPSSTPTPARLALEIVQTQAWTDSLGNARANVVFHNPYDYPVQAGRGAQAVLRDAAGKFMRNGSLRFLDGLNIGGFLLPGETMAANACFTCEEGLLTQEWSAVEFFAPIEDATGQWEYSTEVEAAVASIIFDGDSASFWATGNVINNSDQTWQVIGVRIVVYDQDGKLAGALEASVNDVAPGAGANFKSYGIGQNPAGEFTFESSALALNY